MALDVGDKRIGVAMTDPGCTIAQPFSVIEKNGREIEEIGRIVTDYGVGRMVVGMPYKNDGDVGAQAKKTMKFVDNLKAHFGEIGANVAIATWDESMTTHDAHERMKEMGVKHSQRKKVIDKIAAVIILESYLSGMKE